MLTVTRLESPAQLAALDGEWSALLAEVSPYLPFRTPLWNRLWWRHFHRASGGARDEFFAHAVRDGRGRLIGVAPLMLTSRGVGPIGCVRLLHFFGADAFMTEWRGLVCRREDQARVLAALRGHLAGCAHQFDWIEWSGLHAEDADPASRAGLVPQQTISDHYLRLPGSWEAFKTALPRNIKESLRKCYNSLKRDGHAFELRVVTRPAEVPVALDLFFALHGLRAGAAEMQAHKNVFEDPRAQAFLRDFATTLAERDELRLFQLCVAGRVVATRIGFLAGAELYLYYSGYDVAWGKYSVMTTTTAEAIQWAIAERLDIVNLSLGSDVSKLRWRPEELPYEQLVEVSPTLRGRIAYSLFDGVGRQLRAGGVRAALAAKLRPRPVETPAASLQESA